MRDDKRAMNAHKMEKKTIGAQLNFASSEAYKLLRANVSLTLPKQEGCRILGVTSTYAGEGKSTTSINLAYSLAQDGKAVLLIEGDLRRPTTAERLDLKASPGLSNLLVGMCTAGEAVQESGINKNLMVLAAGDIPPNPSELLNSVQMEITVQTLSKSFDYIIIDLPPVSAVSDALVIVKLVDSVIVVVCRNFCRKKALEKTLQQLELINANVLGIVMTHGERAVKQYRKYGYGYGHSGYGYGYGYGYGPDDSGKKKKKSKDRKAAAQEAADTHTQSAGES